MPIDFVPPRPNLAVDVDFGFLDRGRRAPRQNHPEVVLNSNGTTVLRTLRTELARADDFTFSVAFVSPGAVALLKQELAEFAGSGRIITSDYLAFNSPASFAELLKLKTRMGYDVRVHRDSAFHPKGYIFRQPGVVTAMVGSSNLTKNALVSNHEWNLKVSAAHGSDLASQFSDLVARELSLSDPLTEEWIADYATRYVKPPERRLRGSADPATSIIDLAPSPIVPNAMQRDALLALAQLRSEGKRRGIIVSATGTGKTILSALDVRAVDPQRLLFVVHREQILDRAIEEYRRVLGAPRDAFGKLTGASKQFDRAYTFATVQTLSTPEVLAQVRPDDFDYVIFDEAHRTGAQSHQRLLNYFEPEFMLGMTATPERGDGINVFEFFNHNVAYEIRLNRALEEGMLAPFHYYGVADVTLPSGEIVDDEAELSVLISPERVHHVVEAIDLYGQAGVQPRGLIFCSRKQEAQALSKALNGQSLNGRLLRAAALTGDDPMWFREETVERLERGELDYILTVDIFNEGVDIPSVNQVIMLRQTQSAIVFVQQLGRGLRKAEDKEYLVVIDFIGNYANNFMIPIALFGDESLNKESLRKNLIAAEESGVLPGLSSVRFDRIAQERVLASIASTKLDKSAALKAAIKAMQDRVGRPPLLWDFHRFESVDPVVLATHGDHFPAVLERYLGVRRHLTETESRQLRLLSHDVLTSKRLHEFVLLRQLLERGSATVSEVAAAFAAEGIHVDATAVSSAIDTLSVTGFTQQDLVKYTAPLAHRTTAGVKLSREFRESYAASSAFCDAVNDLLSTGEALTRERYAVDERFTRARQYSRRDAARLLGWQRNVASTIYGYKTDATAGFAAIFLTLHKHEDVSASTAYGDEIIDPSTMRWFSRSNRTLTSTDTAPIVNNKVEIHVFAQKDGAEGSDHYYLGRARSEDPRQTTMRGNRGEALNVVQMSLRFDHPIETALYDYFRPVVTHD